MISNVSLFSESLRVPGVTMFMHGKFRVTGNIGLSDEAGLVVP